MQTLKPIAERKPYEEQRSTYGLIQHVIAGGDLCDYMSELTLKLPSP